MVTIELPPAAKTPYTVFRWWQPQQGESIVLVEDFKVGSILQQKTSVVFFQ